MDEVFVVDVVDLLCLDDLSFVQKFEGDVFSGFFILGDFDFAKASFAEDSADFVVFEFEFSDGLALSFSHRIFY